MTASTGVVIEAAGYNPYVAPTLRKANPSIRFSTRRQSLRTNIELQRAMMVEEHNTGRSDTRRRSSLGSPSMLQDAAAAIDAPYDTATDSGAVRATPMAQMDYELSTAASAASVSNPALAPPGSAGETSENQELRAAVQTADHVAVVVADSGAAGLRSGSSHYYPGRDNDGC